MKKLFIAGLITAALAGVSASSFAGDFYVGASAGQSKIDLSGEANLIRAEMAAFGETGTVSTDESGSGFKVFGGYNLHKNVAVEFGYADLGSASLGVDITAPAAANFKAEYDASGFFVDLVGKLPVTNDFTVFGKVGAIASTVEATYSGDFVGSDKASETNVKFGIGAEYAFTKQVAVRGEFERYQGLGKEETTGESDVDLVSIGLTYKF